MTTGFTKVSWVLGACLLFLSGSLILQASDKPFMKYPITMGVERKIVVDPENGQKNLQFFVSITNTHYLIDTEDLELTLLAFGEYDGRPNVNLRDHRQYKVLDRMLLNQKAKLKSKILPIRRLIQSRS